MPVNLRGRNFLKLLDYSPAEIRYLLGPVQNVQGPQAHGHAAPLSGGQEHRPAV